MSTSSGKPSSSNAINMALSAALALCMSISGFALKWQFETNARIQVFSVQLEAVQEALEKTEKKSELDQKQDTQLAKQWTLHSWAKQEIDSLRFNTQQGPSTWPNLSNTEP